MDSITARALDYPVDKAARSAVDAAVQEISVQADLLVGTGPLPGTAEWDSEQGSDQAADRELLHHMVTLRICLAAGLDPLPYLISLRRFGVTWEQIGAAVGTSRQAAFERWAAKVRGVLDAYGTGELGGPVADDEDDLPQK